MISKILNFFTGKKDESQGLSHSISNPNKSDINLTKNTEITNNYQQNIYYINGVKGIKNKESSQLAIGNGELNNAPSVFAQILSNFRKDELITINRSLKLKVSGDKPNLIEEICTKFKGKSKKFLNEISKQHLKLLCEKLHLEGTGNKEDLIKRIIEVAEKELEN